VFLRRLLVPLAVALIACTAGDAVAQAIFPPVERWGASADCVKAFAPLRDVVERHRKLIKAAFERRAPADEACKLIGNFSQAQLKMTQFIEANVEQCGISPRTNEQFRASQARAEEMQKQVCAITQRPFPLTDTIIDWPSVGGRVESRKEPTGPAGDFGHWIKK